MEKVFVFFVRHQLQFKSFFFFGDGAFSETSGIVKAFISLPSSQDTESGRFILCDSDFSARKRRCLK